MSSRIILGFQAELIFASFTDTLDVGWKLHNNKLPLNIVNRFSDGYENYAFNCTNECDYSDVYYDVKENVCTSHLRTLVDDVEKMNNAYVAASSINVN